MKVLAIIPARAGSKGVAQKNLKPLAGKPLICWTIEQAVEAHCIDRVVVSTNDAEIAKISRDAGAEVPFLRPNNISGDTATTESALIHTLNWLKKNEGYHPDAISLLQCTSPIRSSKSIDDACRQFVQDNADSLLSVVPFWHFLWQTTPTRALYDYRHRPRRQDVNINQMKYKENGSIYLSKTDGFMQAKNRIHGTISLFVMPEDEGIEIDTELDFLIAEAIVNYRGKPG